MAEIHVHGEGPSGLFRAVLLANGTLLRLAVPAEAEELPGPLLAALLRDREAGQTRLERVWLMAYELEDELPDGSEHEIFVDPLGRRLFEVTKPPMVAGDESLEGLADLPLGARQTIELHLGHHPLARLQRELEWGLHRVHAARWSSTQGSQEIKVFDDGRVLFVELPPAEPVPAIVRELADGSGIEALLLQVWAVTDQTGAVSEALFLSTGDRIEVPDGG